MARSRKIDASNTPYRISELGWRQGNICRSNNSVTNITAIDTQKTAFQPKSAARKLAIGRESITPPMRPTMIRPITRPRSRSGER